MTRTHAHRFLTPKESVNHRIVYLSQQGYIKPQTAQLSLQVAGRLSHLLSNWEVLTTDKWVIDTVKGFQIPFASHPVQESWPNPPIYSTELDLLIQEEVKALLAKGAVQA